MKTVTCCTLVLALALVAVPAVQAAEMAAAAPAAEAAVVTAPAAQTALDAPVVEMMAPDQQPVFANLQPPAAAAGICIDSGVHCNSTSQCYTDYPFWCYPNQPCVCDWNGIDYTCQIC